MKILVFDLLNTIEYYKEHQIKPIRKLYRKKQRNLSAEYYKEQKEDRKGKTMIRSNKTYNSKKIQNSGKEVENTIENIVHSNADLLTKGRQTLDVITNNSVTAATAYRNMYDFIKENIGFVVMSATEWVQAFFTLYDKPSIRHKDRKIRSVKKRVYDGNLHMYVTRQTHRSHLVVTNTESLKETRTYLLKVASRFASYIKHKERGKLERRAIASANMIMRMPLYITEFFNLAIGKKIPASSISIGGEDKRKITEALSAVGGQGIEQPLMFQGTEDATKWNEMDQEPRSSKRVKYFDADYEETVLKWFAEINSDDSDIESVCDANTAEDETVIETEESDSENTKTGNEERRSNYYYGKNRYKWSKEPATSNRGRRPQHNIVLQLPGLREAAKGLGDCVDPLSVWKLLFIDDICEKILKWTNVRIERERAKYKVQTSPMLRNLDIDELYALMGSLALTAVFKYNNENIDTLFATNGTGRESIAYISNDLVLDVL
nr:unnamed protein product [Callosobruchus analis]